MKQQTLAVAADQTFENYRKPTRRDEFLKSMEAIVPWSALCEVIEPFYPKTGNGRPPIGLERMLRIHFIQHWFNLADLACEESLYDSASLRRFVGIDLDREPVPDATTMLKFRRLLSDHKLGQALFAKVGQELLARGLKLNTGKQTVIPANGNRTNLILNMVVVDGQSSVGYEARQCTPTPEAVIQRFGRGRAIRDFLAAHNHPLVQGIHKGF